MKLSILQENLNHAVTTASRSASAKASLPVLNHVLLSTDQGRVKISATNLETGVSCWVGAKVEAEGSIAVPARVLQDLVSGLKPGKVELEVVKGNLHLTSDAVEANLSGIDGSEFPAIPSFSETGAFSLPATELASAVNDIAYASASEESRPVLTGVLWRVKGQILELVATDGYRLARKELKLAEKAGEDWQVIIPSRALNEVSKVVTELTARGESPDEVKISLSTAENQISFSLGTVDLTSRLLEGQYPPFEQIIPSDFVVRGVFLREELTQAVRLTSVFARDIGSIVKVKIGGSGLELSANTSQIGDERTTISGEVSGEEVNVAFNSRYLLDALGHLGKTQVSFEIKSNLSPGVFRGVGDESLQVLIMPVRVQS